MRTTRFANENQNDEMRTKFKMKFGNICSICVGICTIINLIKSMISTAMNCIMLRRIGTGLINICKFTAAPSTFLLKKMPEYGLTENKWKGPINNSPNENLLKLRKLNDTKMGPI